MTYDFQGNCDYVSEMAIMDIIKKTEQNIESRVLLL